MRLFEGVKIITNDDNFTFKTKVSKSKGVWFAHEDMNQSIFYTSNAIIPKTPWEELEDNEIECLVFNGREENLDAGSFISVVKVPDTVVAPFDEIRLAIKNDCSRDHISGLLKNSNCVYGIENIKKFSSQFGQHLEKVFLGTNPANLLTVTYDPSDEKQSLIGLHVDNWYTKNLADRHLSPRRMCINLGVEDRYFLFINQPLKILYDTLEANNSQDNRRHRISTDLGHAFMSHFPEYPIIKLKISPNEAYIASTDNLVHDGSTLGNTFIDFCSHIHGYFVP